MNATEQLPVLLDSKALQRELGITRAAAESLMRALDVVVFPGLRKTFVKHGDVVALIERQTFGKDRVAV
jgi:hypothetical protein